MTRLAVVLCVLAACDDGGGGGPLPTMFGTDDRPVQLLAPDAPTPGKQYPLVMILHGFGASGFVQTAFFGMSDLASDDEALVIAPDGTPSSADGRLFWNADPACCDFANQNPDDVAYLGDILDDVIATWPVDPDAVYVIGHSNGGFMSFRMACERADIIAGIMSLAGLAASNAADCTPERAVNVLQVHGTLDETVPFQGGGTGIGQVGAAGSVEQWATHNGCSSSARTPGADLDLDNAVAGAETHTESTTGCPDGGAAELWTMEGSKHIPGLRSEFKTSVLAWLLAHDRRAPPRS